MDTPVRLIAFYLPQFHPIPENDSWWGQGFTEWTSLTRALPMYEGHHQPDLPADLGFYDLRLPEVQIQQAELAKQYGIYGFCYYYYWFSGKRLLERPLEAMRQNPAVDLPYCLCYANENWTRRWDGEDQHVLMAQDHSPEDDHAFIESLVHHFEDPRYIRVDGKPMLVVYRTGLFPDIAASAERWRAAAREFGVGELYLVKAEAAGDFRAPASIGFDSACEFPPHPFGGDIVPVKPLRRGFKGLVLDYTATMNRFRLRPRPAHPLMRGVFPAWDNTPRKMEAGLSYVGSSPEQYKKWLSFAVRDTLAHNSGDERIVFINAWNEWGEGAHLEPCKQYGRRNLEVTAEVLADPADPACVEELVAALPVGLALQIPHAADTNWPATLESYIAAFPEDLGVTLLLQLPEAPPQALQTLRDRIEQALRPHSPRRRSRIRVVHPELPADLRGILVTMAAMVRPVPPVEFRHSWLTGVRAWLEASHLPDIEKAQWRAVSDGWLARQVRTPSPVEPAISLVVLTLNQLPITRQCFESLAIYTTVPYELLVIDNGSRDGTREYLRELEKLDARVRVIFNENNMGFSHGCNQGIARARAEVIILLNNDTVLTEGWAEGLIAPIQANPKVGAVGPRTNNIVGQQQLASVPYGHDLAGLQAFARSRREANPGQGQAVGRLIGFCIALRREALKTLGGLDSRLGTGNFEDDDICLRLRIAGHVLWQAEDVFIHHWGSQTFKGEGVDYSAQMKSAWSKFAGKWDLPPDMTGSYPVHELAKLPFDERRDVFPILLTDLPGHDVAADGHRFLVKPDPESPEALVPIIRAYGQAFTHGIPVSLVVWLEPRHSGATGHMVTLVQSLARQADLPLSTSGLTVLAASADPITLSRAYRTGHTFLSTGNSGRDAEARACGLPVITAPTADALTQVLRALEPERV